MLVPRRLKSPGQMDVFVKHFSPTISINPGLLLYIQLVGTCFGLTGEVKLG